MMCLQLAGAASADEGCDESKRRHGPPPEALDACADSQEGAECSFIGRHDREVSGTCELKRDALACVPEWHRHRERPDDASQG